jgi:hypothetical protein
MHANEPSDSQRHNCADYVFSFFWRLQCLDLDSYGRDSSGRCWKSGRHANRSQPRSGSNWRDWLCAVIFGKSIGVCLDYCQHSEFQSLQLQRKSDHSKCLDHGVGGSVMYEQRRDAYIAHWQSCLNCVKQYFISKTDWMPDGIGGWKRVQYWTASRFCPKALALLEDISQLV